MDGVVVDNHRFHFAAWMEFARRYKFPLDEEIYRHTFNGKTNADLFKMIFNETNSERVRAWADEKESMYREAYAAELRPLDGLREFLGELKQRGVKIALGTSAPVENVDFVLDGLQLRGDFSVIVDGGMVERGKPDPQVYQLCSQKLGLHPSECVVFEDSLAGLDSGKAAGCRIVAVATSTPVDVLRTRTENIIKNFYEASFG